MSCPSESALSAYAVQTLEALEGAGQSLIDRCKDLRQNPTRTQQEQLEKLMLSAISAIQSVWNTISPIHRLPSEVLVHVFSLVPQWCPVSRTNAQRGHWPFAVPDINTNFQLATVCKHWRNLIRGTPALWSVVSETEASNPHLPNMWALARCPRGPLSVSVSGRVSPRMWLLLQGEGHRIQQLHITNILGVSEETMLALLQSFPANRLEHCKIDISTPKNKRQRSLSLFSGDGRSLRSLYLDRVPFLPSNTFPRLSYLIIDRFFNREDPHWDLGDLLNFLVGCPRLEHLHLSRVWSQNCPRPNISAGATRVVFSHLKTFTLDLHGRLIAGTLQALLSIVELPRTCQIQLKQVPLNELQAISPSLLSLGRPLTRMRLALGAADQDHTGSPRWDWSLVLASSQPECAAIRLVLEPAHATQVPALLGPNFSKLPLFENVEELWCRSGLSHEDLLRPILLPRKVRSLALSLLSWIPGQSASHLAQVARVGGQLDTLCICVPNAEHLRGVRVALMSLGPDGKPRCRAIRRVAVGYDRPSTRLSRGAISLRDCRAGTGTEVSWTGQIAGRSEGDTEMDRLLSVAPQVLEEPASIRAAWPTWSGFLSD